MKTSFVILAAGMGTRLGRSHPKTLTQLINGKTILQSQIEAIQSVYGKEADINIVVGYKAEEIAEVYPNLGYIHNSDYDVTNTSKSLMQALRVLPKGNNVLWMNGDLVFDVKALELLKLSLDAYNENLVAVTTETVSDEEVKFTVNSENEITSLSKTVPLGRALGEAVGINHVTAKSRPILEHWLAKCEAQDYFERGIEYSFERDILTWSPFDLSKLGIHATEVDFAEDLVKANSHLI